MKLPWRHINDIIKKKDFEALQERANNVFAIYYITGAITTLLIIWIIK